MFCFACQQILFSSISLYFNSIVGKISGQLKDEEKILNVVSHNKYILHTSRKIHISLLVLYLVSSF